MVEQVAALYVEAGGCYVDQPGVDPWTVERDARLYAGPHPVVAHPPCQRWGRYWHGSPQKPHQFALGDDGGCFAAALRDVRRWGGVLEHPADSHAWRVHGLIRPPRSGGWVSADAVGGSTCYVEQGFYGHVARKGTWLYVNGVALSELRWGRGEQRLSPVLVERYGYEYARRAGMISMIGGKRKTELRNATPPAFRDVLLGIARSRYQHLNPEDAMAHVKIEMDRGHGWETRQEGEVDTTAEHVKALLSEYAIQYPHRAFVDGKLVGEVPPAS